MDACEAPRRMFSIPMGHFHGFFYYDPFKLRIGLDSDLPFRQRPTCQALDRYSGRKKIRSALRDALAPFCFTDNGHDKFFNNAIESGWFDIVYEDTDCTILRIREQKGEPPPELPESGVINDGQEPLPDEELPQNEEIQPNERP